MARFSTRVATAELPDGGRCIAFSWVEGRPCGRRPSRRLVADLGRVIGTLHRHAQRFCPPPGFTRPALDIQHLTWAGTWHADQLARRPIDPAVGCVLTETAGRVEAVLARLGRGRAGYGLVHADLDLGNVLDHHGQARPIDFDDASWGHYALDLAIAADSVPRRCARPCSAATRRRARFLPAMKSTRPRCWPPAASISPSGTWPTGCQTSVTSASCEPSPRTDPLEGRTQQATWGFRA